MSKEPTSPLSPHKNRPRFRLPSPISPDDAGSKSTLSAWMELKFAHLALDEQPITKETVARLNSSGVTITPVQRSSAKQKRSPEPIAPAQGNASPNGANPIVIERIQHELLQTMQRFQCRQQLEPLCEQQQQQQSMHQWQSERLQRGNNLRVKYQRVRQQREQKKLLDKQNEQNEQKHRERDQRHREKQHRELQEQQAQYRKHAEELRWRLEQEQRNQERQEQDHFEQQLQLRLRQRRQRMFEFEELERQKIELLQQQFERSQQLQEQEQEQFF